ncbi:uncharacterized protein LOC131070878 [Cryptomeria japonica]|uniref:uncharacterized protein LOC131070878 n=1 Tax=Cryptomeria japonica TaxID=3369 RepID=UPI0025AD8918|nr:uncharacterized protein LOC131070878 [Cryptomeria japonica]
MVYGKLAMMSIEFEHKTLRTALQLNMNLFGAQRARFMQLNALDEVRKMSLQHIEVVQNQRTRWHDKYITERKFKSRELALLYDSRYKDSLGKLQTCWLGPYEVVEVFQNGSVQLATIDPDKFKLLVNCHRLRLYHKLVTKEEFLQPHAAVPAAHAGGLTIPQS